MVKLLMSTFGQMVLPFHITQGKTFEITSPYLPYETFVRLLTCHFFDRHTLSEMENFKFQFYVAYWRQKKCMPDKKPTYVT